MSSLQDIATVVSQSADVNEAQLIGRQDGTVEVPVYNWTGFFSGHFRKLPKIKSYHHFTFSSCSPGIV